jgi:hypothetical protein
VIEGTGEAVEVNGSQDEDPGGRTRVAGVSLDRALGGLSSKGRDLMQLMEVIGVLMGVVDLLSPNRKKRSRVRGRPRTAPHRTANDFQKHLEQRIQAAVGRARWLGVRSNSWGPAHRLRIYKQFLVPKF